MARHPISRSCPQLAARPRSWLELDRSRQGEGSILRWLRPLPPIPALVPVSRYPAGVSRTTTVVAAGGTGPRSRQKDRVPGYGADDAASAAPPRQAQPLSHKASRARRTQGLGSGREPGSGSADLHRALPRAGAGKASARPGPAAAYTPIRRTSRQLPPAPFAACHGTRRWCGSAARPYGDTPGSGLPVILRASLIRAGRPAQRRPACWALSSLSSLSAMGALGPRAGAVQVPDP